jgi:L-lactate permease
VAVFFGVLVHLIFGAALPYIIGALVALGIIYFFIASARDARK